jgi:hypothetical protein
VIVPPVLPLVDVVDVVDAGVDVAAGVVFDADFDELPQALRATTATTDMSVASPLRLPLLTTSSS